MSCEVGIVHNHLCGEYKTLQTDCLKVPKHKIVQPIIPKVGEVVALRIDKDYFQAEVVDGQFFGRGSVVNKFQVRLIKRSNKKSMQIGVHSSAFYKYQ